MIGALAKGRKHGLCPIYGVQSYDLLSHSYSDSFKHTLLSLVQTVVQLKAFDRDADTGSKRGGAGEYMQLNFSSVDRMLSTGQMMGKITYTSAA